MTKMDDADRAQLELATDLSINGWWREEALLEALFCDYPERRTFQGLRRAVRKLRRSLKTSMKESEG